MSVGKFGVLDGRYGRFRACEIKRETEKFYFVFEHSTYDGWGTREWRKDKADLIAFFDTADQALEASRGAEAEYEAHDAAVRVAQAAAEAAWKARREASFAIVVGLAKKLAEMTGG
jgi:hypothetical protein